MNEYIYHYTSDDALLNIINSKTIRFTKSEFLNDITEGEYIYDFIESHKKQILDQFIDNEYFEEIKDALSEENLQMNKADYEVIYHPEDDTAEDLLIDYDYYVFSTSMEDDLLNMWNYYLHNHSYNGYSIKINKNELIKELKTKFGAACIIANNVIYTEEEQLDKIVELIKDAACQKEKYWGKAACMFDSIPFIDGIRKYRILFKPAYMADEKEFRIAIKFDDSVQADDYFIRNGIIVPYKKAVIENLNKIISGIRVAPTQEFELARRGLTSLFGNNDIKIEFEDIIKSNIKIR